MGKTEVRGKGGCDALAHYDYKSWQSVRVQCTAFRPKLTLDRYEKDTKAKCNKWSIEPLCLFGVTLWLALGLKLYFLFVWFIILKSRTFILYMYDIFYHYPHAFFKKWWGYCNLLCPSVTLSPPKPLDEIQPNLVCVCVAHMNGVCNGTFFWPRPPGAQRRGQ